MSPEISAKLQELPHLPKAKLAALWQELFAKPAHPRLRRNLMIPILAYHLQEHAYGGLKPATHKSLQKLAANLEQNRKAPLPLVPQLKPGTKLRPVRFRLEGKRYCVEAVLDQWYDPQSISYKVRADDGNVYILRQQTSTPNATWDLVSFPQTREER